ncbi:MAG: helix-turn-helix domain-containing protein, partial [Oxalobacter sp.]|nr:helix-turn-helix domain-containing protein [Oxalobacter sp.]
MGIKTISAILSKEFDLKNLNSIEKLVYITLGYHNNDTTNVCNPSYDTLSKELNYSRRAIIKAIKGIEGAGHVRRETRTDDNGKCISNRYILVLPDRGSDSSSIVNNGSPSIVNNGSPSIVNNGSPSIVNNGSPSSRTEIYNRNT